MSRTRSGLLRILDANLNRSREGLRVCEEVARFVLNSGSLTKDLKRLRHAITAVMKKLPPRARPDSLECRDVEGDVGRDSKKASEARRAGYRDIFSANIERVKESLRVLEEFSKLIDAERSREFRRLRFEAYDIEKRAAGKSAPVRHRGQGYRR